MAEREEADRFDRLSDEARRLEVPEFVLDNFTDVIASGNQTEAEAQEALQNVINLAASKAAVDVEWHVRAYGVESIVGKRVKVVSLKNAAQHNGHTGEVIRYDASTERFAVQLDSSQLRIKAANLQLLDVTPNLIPETKVPRSTATNDPFLDAVQNTWFDGCAACGEPRRMPSGDGASSNLLECTRCLLARYCSPECQREAWLNGHRDSCCPWIQAACSDNDLRVCPQDRSRLLQQRSAGLQISLPRTIMQPYSMTEDFAAQLEIALGHLKEFGLASAEVVHQGFAEVDSILDEYLPGGSKFASMGQAASLSVAVKLQRCVSASLAESVVRPMRHHLQQARREKMQARQIQTSGAGNVMESIQGMGCQLLMNLTQAGSSDEENDEFILSVAKAGGLEAAIEALSVYEASPGMMHVASTVVALCGIMDACKGSITDEERDGGSYATVVVASMQALASDADAQRHGLEALRAIAAADCALRTGRSISGVCGPSLPGANPANLDRSWTRTISDMGAERPSSVMAAGGVTAAVQALKAFETDPRVVGVGAQVLMNVCNSGAAAQWELAQAGAMTQLAAVMRRYHEEDPFLDELRGHVLDKVAGALQLVENAVCPA